MELNERSTVSWRGVLAGVLVCFAITNTLNIMGGALRLWTVDEDNFIVSAGPGLSVYRMVTFLIGLFAGGYVASWLGRLNNARIGAMEGVLVWSAAIILSQSALFVDGLRAFGGRIAGVPTPGILAMIFISYVAGLIAAAGGGARATWPKAGEETPERGRRMEPAFVP